MVFVHIVLIRLHGVTEHIIGIQREVVKGLSRGDE